MEKTQLVVAEQRIPPVRGLVLTHNADGQPFDVVDLKRWVRVNHDVFKTDKVDVFINRSRDHLLPSLSELANTLDVKLSLRTDGSLPPDDSGLLRGIQWFDVFLCPRSVSGKYVDAWFEACRAASLPLRLQIQAPFDDETDLAALAARIEGAGVVAVNVTLADPFLRLPPCRDAAHSRQTVDEMNVLTAGLAARGVEVNLLGLPLCLVTEENLPHAANAGQFLLDHQQYKKTSYDLACALFACRPSKAAKAIQIHASIRASLFSPIDWSVLPWILHKPWLNARLLIARKITRSLRVIRRRPKPLAESVQAYQREVDRVQAEAGKQLGPACARCRLRRICDHESEAFKRVAPGLGVTPIPGDLVVWPLHFAATQPKYYDAVDAGRIACRADRSDLAKRANEIVTNVPPTREIDSSEYKIEGQWTHQMPGGVRWFSYTSTEKLSTILTRTAPPMTLSVTFGGGMADFIGFSFGRHCKLLCPMEAASHTLACHVDAAGHYVLLRDGHPVYPTQFEGVEYVPSRLGGVLEPRISIWNIDGAIVTQAVLLWTGENAFAAQAGRVKYSVVIVCTRFARRLQAALLALAHQQGIDLDRLEVIVTYVPGVDATDDLIDGLKLTHPRLRIVRAPFAEGHHKSKGFMINEAVRTASGEWVVLLDADTLVAPDMFAKIEEIADTCDFIASDGRKMLTPETTARILLGEIEPWREWDALLAGPGEFRLREADGVPIGFFQCIRKSCLDKVQYHEHDHFEGADWFFGYDMRQAFGQEKRLSGVPVLHLDHGGSQWYGTQKQR